MEVRGVIIIIFTLYHSSHDTSIVHDDPAKRTGHRIKVMLLKKKQTGQLCLKG